VQRRDHQPRRRLRAHPTRSTSHGAWPTTRVATEPSGVPRDDGSAAPADDEKVGADGSRPFQEMLASVTRPRDAHDVGDGEACWATLTAAAAR
jgi:hypothetical protein